MLTALETVLLTSLSTPPARYVAKLGVNVPGVRVSVRMTAYVAP